MWRKKIKRHDAPFLEKYPSCKNTAAALEQAVDVAKQRQVAAVQFLANVNSRSRSLYVIVRSSVVCRLSVTSVHPTQAIEIFGNVSTPCGTLAILDLCVKILRRSSQGNPFVGGLNPRGVAKYSNFRPFDGYISETMQDMI